MKKSRILILGLGLALSTTLVAQDSAPENWFNLDKTSDNVQGVSTEKTYQDLLKSRTSETVIVAVIDSGVDYEHEDLKDVMWVNPGEIAGNGKDDDNNGYVDDIHGWNFIGGKDGKNIHHESLEISRLVANYRTKFKGKDVASLSKKEKKEYDHFKSLESDINTKKEELETQAGGVLLLSRALESLKKKIGKDASEINSKDIQAVDLGDEQGNAMKERILSIMEGQGASFGDLDEQIGGASEYFTSQLDYYYNPDYNPRSEIVGDDYMNSKDRNYGNSDVKGPDASHGTHVAGIIAAVRDNDTGIKGVADNVKIMSIRAVPDGDERDKDVANAIFYAVDNGASIINMSFGKGHSWDKGIVDEAVKYAQKNDVLLVHAAGNSAQNNDSSNNYPNDTYDKKGLFAPKQSKTWIEVGALSWQPGEKAVASFSNYGIANVDLFAPGHQIMSTTPEQGYEKFSGTSMASPVTAGVAAVLRSYFPTLSAKQVKEILMSSVVTKTDQVLVPGQDGTKAAFNTLCKSGGVVNTYKAVQQAMNTKGKRKGKGKTVKRAYP